MVKKSVIVILVLGCLIGLLGGCGNSGVNPDTTDGTTAATKTSESGADTVDVLPILDYKGAEVKLCTWTATDEWVLETDDLSKLTTIDYASYQHLKNVEERLKVAFRVVTRKAGGWGKHEDFVDAIERTAGDGSYDLICQYSLAAIYGAQRGLYVDLNSFDYFNAWQGAYWNENLIASNTINDRIYYVTGDLSPTTVTRIGAMVFNRTIVSAQDPNLNLYGLVNSGDWTLATLLGLTRDVYTDVNNNGSRDVGDQYGFVIPSDNVIDLLQYGADLPCIITDSNGSMMMNPQFTENGEKAIKLVETLRNLCWNYDGIYLGYTPRALQGDPSEKGNSKYNYHQAMKNGNAMFQLMWTHDIISDVRSSGIDYGILPIPKYDTEQTAYHTALEMTYSMFSIPTDCRNKEMVAAVLEAMGSDGYTYLVPEIFEKQLKYQYAKTADDSVMFELLRNGIIYEPGRIFSYIDCFSLLRRAVKYDKEWTTWYLQEAGTAYQERLENILFEFQ